MTGKFYYIATPYTKFAGGPEAAYEAALSVHSAFARADVSTYGPIVQTHPVEQLNPGALSHQDWLDLDFPLIEASAGLIVIMLPGYEDSLGVRKEIAYARKIGKLVAFMPEWVAIEPILVRKWMRERMSLSLQAVHTRSELDNLVVYGTTHPRRLPADIDARKNTPMATGCLDYFPDALAAVARLSKIGNDKHNPGEPLHWSRHKSTDHADCILRHMADRGTFDDDGELHDVKVAWRALAQLQLAIENLKAPVQRDTAQAGQRPGPV